MEKNSDTHFERQEGYDVKIEKHDFETILPITMPLKIKGDIKIEDILKIIAQAPRHEVLLYAICLQVLEWGIRVNTAK
jgi:hypothetical protein